MDFRLPAAGGMRPPHWSVATEVPGFMSQEELGFLAETASKVTSWTELGGFIGRSLLAVGLSLPPNSRLQVVDYQLGFHKRAGQTLLDTYETIVGFRPDLEVILVKCDSAKAASYLKGSEVVFIDAGHGYESVKADIQAWKGKTNKLLGHDYDPDKPGVIRAVDEAFGKPARVVDTVWEVSLPKG